MNPEGRHSTRWLIGAALGVLVVALALRYGTNILGREAVFDERYIRVPIEDLLERGWSVETAVDFKETKGPALIWLYAAGGAVLGGGLDDLRLLSVLLFAGAAVPLLLIARRCGVAGPGLAAVAALYVLLPGNAALGQLVMSEPSFIFGALWLLWVFLWGFGASGEQQRAVAGPLLFGLLLAVLLHHRIHAVAFAAAAALVAFERDRWRSWPWWAACAAAGLARVPLLLRWGGLVSPEYQTVHGLGLSLESFTYLAAAAVPMTGLLLWPGLRAEPAAARRWLIWAGLGAGLLLVLVARPGVGTDTLSFGDRVVQRYLGFIATLDRKLDGVPGVHVVLVGLLPIAGSGAYGALAALGFSRPVTDSFGVVARLALWTLLAGCGMYVLTDAVVFDRYLLPWAVLLPVLWLRLLPAPALALQALALAAIDGWIVWRLLIR